MPGRGMRTLSYELALEIRLAHQQRLLAIELAEESGEPPPPFTPRATLADDPERVGLQIRELLGATEDDRTHWASDKEGYTALNTWRARIEKIGVLVFQAQRVSSDEASGFAIAESPMPAIVVSRSDTPRRRTFSLLHEFAHLMLRVSGVSEIDVDAARPPEDLAVEVFCNRVASAVLMPRDLFVAEAIIRTHRSGPESWSDEDITNLSHRYGVSREVVVRRMLTFNLTTQRFYTTKREQYKKAFETWTREKKAKMRASKKQFAKNPPRDALSNLGQPLVRRILESYYQDRLSLSDVSSYLGIRARHVEKLESMVGGP
ncbi:hypothetical protein DSM104443_01769 [Usitatibacter rugosus]|uniref:IrrE N-terminal-like domain-containing protein n=2 Tax=Usitatibacter rugosus TaxID=2732067 RepID=A0A6M4GUI8_9PROT|nr:hypothetical protein DSM104443_01769 [Usitatibacter rugosus]